MSDENTRLDEIMAKESWTAEECQEITGLLAAENDPVRTLREAAAALNAADPSPVGSAAVKLGVVRCLLSQFEEAAELLAAGTDNKERRFYQGLCYKQLRQWNKAIESFQWAEDRGWDPREVTLQLAELQCLAGDLAAARRSVDRFAKSSQEDADWYHIAGLVREMAGEYDEAVECYDTARRLEAGHPAATFRLAYYYDLHGNEEEALELYRECVSAAAPAEASGEAVRHPVYASALLNLAVLYEDAGRYEDAARCLKRILTSNPSHARARLFLRDVQASKTMIFDEDEAKRVALRNDLLSIPVTDFELSVRARNCLKKMNIRTLGDLLHVTEAELLTYKNFGETSLVEIKSMLASKNLRLGQMLEEGTPRQTITTTPAAATVGNEGVLATPLAQVEFSVRARRALETLDVKTLGELASKSEPELLGCRNFGQTSLNEIQQRLGEYGLGLREP